MVSLILSSDFVSYAAKYISCSSIFHLTIGERPTLSIGVYGSVIIGCLVRSFGKRKHMNPNIKKLLEISSKTTRRIIGLMSGTSLDGLDIALCRISGTGFQTEFELEQFATIPYENQVRQGLLDISSKPVVSMELLCYQHTALARLHGQMILEALREWNTDPVTVDCIASHGQTVYHLPARDQRNSSPLNSTLQIGDGDHLAAVTGILTISDFRQKHTAHGGEGAPLASLADRILFSSSRENRILLNIGGIGNYTILPYHSDPGQIPFSTDTGPGNTLLDKWIEKRYNLPYDRDSEIARSGKIHPGMIDTLLQEEWFDESGPKTTGPEFFSMEWFYKRSHQSGIDPDGLPPEDVAATLTELSARTIAGSINRRISSGESFVVYASGGGVMNPMLMERLTRHLEGVELKSVSELKMNPDAKEAVIFAVLANEMLGGEGFPVQDGNGKTKRVNFGKISFPD